MHESMTDRPETIAAETHPKSHKKRIIIGLTILVPLLLVASWYSAVVMGERAIQAQLAEYRDAGQPVDANDFRTPGVADDENRVLLLGEAADALWLEEDGWEYFGVSYNRLIIAENMSSFGELISKNEKTFELLDKALSAPAGDWGLSFTQEDLDGRMLKLSDHRMLLRFLCSTAIGHHINGDDAEAVRNLLFAFDAAQIMRTCPLMIGQLVAISEETMICKSLEQTVYDLQIAPAGSSEAGKLAARRADIETLISKLLDMASLQQYSVRALRGERLHVFNNCRLLARGKGLVPSTTPTWKSKLLPLLSPGVKQDIIILLRRFTSLSEAVGKSSYPDAVAALPPELDLSGWWNVLFHPLLSEPDLPLRHYLGLYFRNRAMRVMAGTALAIRL